ncbi:autotransporter outer membrane beta-barrel domain-containing protein [Variovorax sp. GB1R11]|uniref:autotransporter family protein n=1 Tax=Variovorax sp. GB1R11 TaxID=3443741 RepID=UPI003F48610A
MLNITFMDAARAASTGNRWKQARPAVGLAFLMLLDHAMAQTVGPGSIGTTINVGTGTTTVVGGTTVQTPGYAVRLTGGTLVLDPSGALPGPINLNATAFNSFSIYATGGTVEMRNGPTSFFTSGNASAALWIQNAGVAATSLGGLSIRTTGGYGTVGGLPVGSYGAVASHNARMSLTNGSILTEGVGASGAYAFGSTVTLNNVAVETRAAAYADGTGNYGAYGTIANSLNGVRGTLSITGGSVKTAGNIAYGIFALGSDVVADGTTVNPSGNNAHAVFARTASTISGSRLNVLAAGSGAYGIYANEGSTIALSDSRVETSGTTGYGALSYGANSRLNATNVDVSSSGPGLTAWGVNPSDNVQATFSGGSVQTHGANAHGLYARGSMASITVNDATVTTSGQGASAARVLDATLTATNANLQANGADAVGLGLSSGAGLTARASLTGGILRSAQSDAIALNGGAAQVSLTGTEVTGAPNWLRVIGGTVVAGERIDAPDDVATFSTQSAGLSGVGINILPRSVAMPVAGPISTAIVTASGARLNGAAITEPGATSSIFLSNGTVWNMTGSSNVTALTNNASQVLFSAPVASAFKSLTAVNYAGAGGVIGLNTFLGGDGSPSDRLVVDGGAATGLSSLRIVNAGGGGALTLANGIQVVDAINGGTTAPGAFVLSTRVVAGPYEYLLYRSSVDASNGQAWYLRSEQPTPPAPPVPPGPPTPPQPVPDVVPSPAKAPLYRPEVGAYLSNQRQASGMFLHSLHDRLGEPQWIETQAFDGASNNRRSGWLRLSRKDGKAASRDGNFNVDTDTTLIQGGGDIASWSLINDKEATSADRLHLGLMMGYGKANTDASAVGNLARAEAQVEGWSAGAYGTWYQNDENRLGWYVDVWGTYGWFNSTVQGNTLPKVKYHADALTLSGEIGYAMKLGLTEWVVEPQAQLAYVKYGANDISEPNGTRVSGGRGSGSISRLGLRTHRTWIRDDGRKIQPYITVNWWRDSLSNAAAFNEVSLGNLYPKDRYEAKLGLNADLGTGWTGWGILGYQWGSQRYRTTTLSLGAKYTW